MIEIRCDHRGCRGRVIRPVNLQSLDDQFRLPQRSQLVVNLVLCRRHASEAERGGEIVIRGGARFRGVVRVRPELGRSER